MIGSCRMMPANGQISLTLPLLQSLDKPLCSRSHVTNRTVYTIAQWGKFPQKIILKIDNVMLFKSAKILFLHFKKLLTFAL